MVDWFRIFIGTATAINPIDNISSRKDIHDSLSLQKETTNTEIYRGVYEKVIFYTYKTAEKLVKVIDNEPLLTYVVSVLLKMRIVELGITTKEFPTHYDKEFFVETKDLLDKIESQTKTRLSSNEEGNANRIIDIVLNDGAMGEYIQGLKVIEDLHEVDLEIKRLQDQQKELMKRGKGSGKGKNKSVYWILIVLSVAFSCFIAFSFLISENLRDNPIFGITYTFCGPAIGIIPLAFVVYKLLGKSKEGNKQNDIIDKKRIEYNIISKRLYTKEKMEKLVSLFGQFTYKDALAIKQEDDDFVRAYISEEDFEQYFKVYSD